MGDHIYIYIHTFFCFQALVFLFYHTQSLSKLRIAVLIFSREPQTLRVFLRERRLTYSYL